MFSPDTFVKDYARLAYFPNRLAGPEHATTRAEYLLQIDKLNRHFQAWLAEQVLADGHPDPQPPRTVALKDLCDDVLKHAMARECELPNKRGKVNSAGTANKLYRHIKPVWIMAAASEARGGPRLVDRLCFTKKYREIKREPVDWWPVETEAIIFAAMTAPGNVGDYMHQVLPKITRRCRKLPRYGLVPNNVFWPALILTDISTAVRITALMSIPTRHWDPDRAQVRVPGDAQKQRADQVFDLLDSANNALKLLDPYGRGVPTLFGDWQSDADGGWQALRRHHEVLLVRAGLFEDTDEITSQDHFHKYRKTTATEIAIKKGAHAAQQYLGHSSLDVTKRYLNKLRMERMQIRDVMADPVQRGNQLRLYAPAG